jgi:hypothetical protein
MGREEQPAFTKKPANRDLRGRVIEIGVRSVTGKRKICQD